MKIKIIIVLLSLCAQVGFAQTKAKPNPKADTAFYQNSGINIGKPTLTQYNSLSLLGKVWGFVKYYHPAVAQGKHNMDSELFRLLPKILKSKTAAQRNNALSQWVTSLGKIKACKKCKPVKFDDQKFRVKPDFSWMTSANLGKQLYSKLQYIFKNRNNKKHYYVKFNPRFSRMDFTNEHTYAHTSYPDTGHRLLALYRYWNIIQYFFPYKYAMDKDWQLVLDDFLPQLIEAKDAVAYHKTIERLVEHIQDSHGFIRDKHKVRLGYTGRYQAAVQVRFIEDKPIIAAYYDDKLGKQTGLKIGDVITKVNGKPVAQIIKERSPQIAASNQAVKLRNIAFMLLRTPKQKLKLTVQRSNDNIAQVEVKCYDFKKLKRSIDWGTTPNKNYKLIAPNIGYVHMGKLKLNEIKPVFKEFKNTKGLIIDLRTYPENFPVINFAGKLYPKPKVFAHFTYPNLHTPGLFTTKKGYRTGLKNKNYYKGKVVILINETTQSSAEYHTMAFRQAPNATVIGSTTAGADGDITMLVLPGGIRTTFTGLGVYYPDGTETQRVGIIPDIKLKPTIAGIKAGKDELLDKAIEVINK
jgi:C-terminal processing protease CtpA/Prc